MTEQTIYSSTDNHVTITNARAIFSNQTYSMANISSVKLICKVHYQNARMLCILCAILFGFWAIGSLHTGSLGSFAFTGILTIVSIIGAIAWNAVKEYIILLTTTAGEQRAFSSYSEETAQEITKALNDALVIRG